MTLQIKKISERRGCAQELGTHSDGGSRGGVAAIAASCALGLTRERATGGTCCRESSRTVRHLSM